MFPSLRPMSVTGAVSRYDSPSEPSLSMVTSRAAGTTCPATSLSARSSDRATGAPSEGATGATTATGAGPAALIATNAEAVPAPMGDAEAIWRVASPHTPQNTAPGSSTAPQREHCTADGDAGATDSAVSFPPHIRQNRIPGGFSAPQRTHANDPALTMPGALIGIAGGLWPGSSWAPAGATPAARGAGSRNFWPQSRQYTTVGGF